MKPIISSFRERITLLKSARKQDQMGGYVDSWAKNQTVWAQVIPRFSTPVSLEKKEWQKPVYTIRVRHPLSLMPSMCFQWKEKILKIIAEPVISPLNEFIEVMAVEVHKGDSNND